MISEEQKGTEPLETNETPDTTPRPKRGRPKGAKDTLAARQRKSQAQQERYRDPAERQRTGDAVRAAYDRRNQQGTSECLRNLREIFRLQQQMFLQQRDILQEWQRKQENRKRSREK